MGLLETRQRLVDGDKISEPRVGAHHRAVEIDAFGSAAMLDALIVPRALDEDAAHGERRGGEEMAPSIPAARRLPGGNPDVGFVHERRRLKRLIRLPFTRKTRSRQFAELVVHFGQKLAGSSGTAVRGVWGGHRTRAIMTPESIGSVKTSYAGVANRPGMLAARFYEALFTMAPGLRPLFPADLASLQGHFEAALALVIRNLDEMDALRESLRDLGAQHVHWGARPEDYVTAREALVTAVRGLAPVWDEAVEASWRHAITAIVVPMLEGAAVQTAMVAEELAADPAAKPSSA
jgi:hemoglobin-like flavoprotein